MAITGIDTIEGKQIIAAGAVSAKSAGMAYNDENGNPITGKLNTSAVQAAFRPPYGLIITGIDNTPISAKVSDSANYAKFDENGTYLTSYLTAVPTGTMNETAFGYDASNNITAYNGSAFAQGGGGSTPTYSYTDNGLISAIDSSGLYASSGSASHLRGGGTMGGNIGQYSGSNTFLYMPQFSPWTTADVATGIFSPLQYATGACLAMDAGNFKAYFKGNEWYVCNTGIGQALRGEVHQSRSVHISGTTTKGINFDLSPTAVRGMNDTANNYNWILQRGYVSGSGANGSWKYGPAEDVALRAVSSCDMHESAFSYDASDNITAYNGSAFKAGDEFPQSATEAIEAVTANSGAWGGSALPISAGAGIKLAMVDNTLVASTSGYVWQSALLFHTDSPVTQTTYTLSDNCSSYDKLEVDFYDVNNWRTVMECPIPSNLAASGTRGGYFSVVPQSTATGANIWFKAFNWTATNTTWSCYCSELAAKGGSTSQTANANQPGNPPKVMNIIGWKRVGGN